MFAIPCWKKNPIKTNNNGGGMATLGFNHKASILMPFLTGIFFGFSPSKLDNACFISQSAGSGVGIYQVSYLHRSYPSINYTNKSEPWWPRANLPVCYVVGASGLYAALHSTFVRAHIVITLLS